MKKYRIPINGLNHAFQNTIGSAPVIFIGPSNTPYTDSPTYDTYTYDVLPIGAKCRRNIEIAFNRDIGDQDRRMALSILYLIFDAK